MASLKLHGRQTDNFFELLGRNENAMTYSLGWALSQSDELCQMLANKLGLEGGFSRAMHISLQDHFSGKGFTDIEMVDPNQFHIVIEAKRGFTVPSKAQLEKYADRLNANSNTGVQKMLVVLAESDREELWLSGAIEKYAFDSIEVRAISWKQFQRMAADCAISTSQHSKRTLLRQLVQYLEKVTTMQNQTSSLVYVVALGGSFDGIPLDPIEIVEKHKKYFHPVGNRWPIEPPNYIAFRYGGKLQSIHHIESYKVIDDYQKDFGLPSSVPTGEKHYLYELGDAIRPEKEVKTIDKAKGFIQIQRSARCECFIDLLLTCDSVSEAFAKTKQRLSTG